ncbi:MAG: metallophosphoesterase [Actinomycetota bacterium]|nr:metallophosphoesterase [Actinomycetota bacterium]
MSVLGLVVFVALLLTVLGLMNYYIWRRVVRSTTRPGSRGRRIGTWLIVVAFLATGIAQVASRLVSPEVARPLAWVGFGWLGVAFYFFLFLLLGELVRLALRIFGVGRRKPVIDAAASAEAAAAMRQESTVAAVAVAAAAAPASGGPGAVRTTPADPTSGSSLAENEREVNRRLFLARSIALGAGVAAAGVGGYGITRALADPVVRRVPVQIAGLDPRLAGFRIALFSDAHLGSIRRRAAMEKLVDTVNGAEPDMVAVLGDLIDGSVAELGGDVAPMAGLQSPHGTYFVTGNHEYYSGAPEWIGYLPDLGVRVLRNERLAIERDGAAFDLAGVNDINGEDFDDPPDFDQALGGRRADRPVVLLVHQPVNVDLAVDYGVDLQLSGHTHGGQLWPFHYIIAAQQGALSGLSRIKETQLYVTSGAGFWGPPMRVGADPEIVVIELQPET